MMPITPQQPRTLTPFETTPAHHVELAVAYSVSINCRNLEKPYNSVWQSVISSLMKPFSNVYQCANEPNLWLSEIHSHAAQLQQLKEIRESDLSNRPSTTGRNAGHRALENWKTLIANHDKQIKALEERIEQLAMDDAAQHK